MTNYTEVCLVTDSSPLANYLCPTRVGEADLRTAFHSKQRAEPTPFLLFAMEYNLL